LEATETQILFELQAISHLTKELSNKLSRIIALTNAENGPVTEKQRELIESLKVWKELFAQFDPNKNA